MLATVTKIFLTFSFMALASGPVDPINEVFEPKGHFPKEDFVKVAVVQTSPVGIAPLTQNKKVVNQFKMQNREALAEFVREAASKGAEIIVTPEFGIVGYPDQPDLPDQEDNFKSPSEIAPYAEDSNDVSFKYFSALAKELKVYIHYGFVTRGLGKDEYYNTIQVVGPEGQLVLEYHKINLFELERKFLKPGTVGQTYESPAGPLGIIICADVYSESALKFYRNKVVGLMLSTSWARPNSGMYQFKATARNMKVYMAAANQTYFPDSGFVNPDGTTQSHIRQSEGIAWGYLPRKK